MSHHPVDIIVASAGVSSPWWFEHLNDGVLVPAMSFAGLVYIICKIVYLIKNKGK
jgi:hypothetical protein